MQAYHDQLRLILDRGTWKEQRAVTAEGKPLRTKSLFGMQARYDLREGFPLVTTKRVPFRLIAAELVWFLSGSTNVKDLHQWDCHIWDEWANKNGDLGPIYGAAWRLYPYPVSDDRRLMHLDQIYGLQKAIGEVRDNPQHHAGRKLILCSWHPVYLAVPNVPTACHTLAQFNVTDGRLSCQMYQRSADMFLGVPFNLASYALLTHLFARHANLQVGELIHTIGDGHIYENHLPQVEEQLTRTPRSLPELWLAGDVSGPLDFTHPDQARVNCYDPWPALKGDVAI